MTTSRLASIANPDGRDPVLGVVIPARNEADFILSTLDSLTFQRVPGGPRIDPAAYEIVVVETASTDATAEQVSDFAACVPVKITLLQEEEASMVTPRIRGMQYLLDQHRPPRFLVSADADTTFPPTWLASMAALLDAGFDLVSSAGYMSPVIWERCPRLTQQYLRHVGPIFFDPVTVGHLDIGDQAYPFTEQLFLDFGRPVSDAGFAITSACYAELGGFQQDYWDDECTSPLAAVGWPLMYRAELSARRVAYLRTPFWSTSPRRLVNEPEALFTTKAYLGEIAAFRATSDDKYEWLNHFADRLDLRPLQEYCLKYYVLQRCITVPQLIRRNSHCFGELRDALWNTILQWQLANPDPTPGGVLAFATELAEEFGDTLLEQLPRTAPPPIDLNAASTGDEEPITPAGGSPATGTMRNPLSGFSPVVAR